jgi:DNA-binding response OmpR family regulator
MNNEQSSSLKKKILAADDDPAILEVLTFMLEDAGYDVKITVNGQTEQMAQEFLPDLILLDIWMAGSDGRKICKSLKGHKLTQRIPIIIISANKDTNKIAKEIGADDFLAKPFEMEELLHKVKTHTINDVKRIQVLEFDTAEKFDKHD